MTEIAGVPHDLIRWTSRRSRGDPGAGRRRGRRRRDGVRDERRHLHAQPRRHLTLVLRGRRRDPGPDDQVVAAPISTHCLDISEPKTVRGLESGYRLYTARWTLFAPARRRPPTLVPDPDRQPPADPGEPAAHRPPGQDAGSG
ncbi:hypothetical protein ACFQ3Z_45460 [Streptomyces nogalater]